MKKIILYASMAFILSLYAVANIEAGSEAFDISGDSIYSTDPCAGGNIDCTYLFAAMSGSDKQIIMARRPTLNASVYHDHDTGDAEYHPEHDTHSDTYSSSDWCQYLLPVYTKSQVQAGYYISSGLSGTPKLVMVYSADQEGKSGAIVGRVSADHGKTWAASKDISGNEQKFGLAVAPNSSYVAFLNTGKDKLYFYQLDYHQNFSWTDAGSMKSTADRASDGLAVVYDNQNSLISVAVKDGFTNALDVYSLNPSSGWSSTSYNFSNNIQKDQAWLAQSNGFELAIQHGRDGELGVYSTTDTSDVLGSGFVNWTSGSDWNRSKSNRHISGMWQCPDTGAKYILSTTAKEMKIEGITNETGFATTRDLYDAGLSGTYGDKNLQRRVSMFNVPAK